MPGLTLVGLGAGDWTALSPTARAALAAGEVYLRTRHHPTVHQEPTLAARPAFAERLRDGESIAATIDAWVTTLVDAAAERPVVYAVPGNPLVGDATVAALLARAGEAGIDVQAVPGGSLVDAAAQVLPPAALAPGLQVIDALDLAMVAERAPCGGGADALSPLRPLLLLHSAPALVIDLARRVLARIYPADAALRIVAPAGPGELATRAATLADWTSAPEDAVALYVEPVSPVRSGRTSDALQQIVARLRAPGGCPWDREQTHRSLVQAAIEEVYEVVDAIERDDPAALREELGDLLLQVYLHAQIAEEADTFTLEDVHSDLAAKLVRRHPHVFGATPAATAHEVLENWDRIKRAERAERGESDDAHPLGRIPEALPALMRAQTVVRRARRLGCLPSDVAATPAGWSPRAAEPGASVASTIADALMAIVLAATEAGVDAEQVLRERTRQLEAATRGATIGTENNRP
ncbi:MAG: MazG family protein [Sphaerobacter sp.]|nr:MazG family protein [Sphaerobacter sp.]